MLPSWLQVTFLILSSKTYGGYLTFIHCTILSSPQAFSAFYFTHKYISTLTNMDMTSPNQTAEAVQRVCSMSISEVLSIKTLRRVDPHNVTLRL